jgi:superfamily II DNA/RNA helicase
MSEPFKWSSPAGHDLCRDILKATPLEYHPHDWQVEGVCQSLDGIDLLAITPTGSGKTSYYTMYILVVLSVLKDPSLCPTVKFPKNACLIVICPTIPLQLEMVSGQRI